MRIVLLGAVMGSLVQDPSGQSARRIVANAVKAVDGDSVDAARRRLSRLASAASPDRSALLGLGALTRLVYEYGPSDSALARVIAIRGDDAVADYARIEQGSSFAVRGRLGEAASLFEQAVAGAVRRGDTTAAAEAMLGLASARARSVAPPAALAMLDRAALLVRNDPALRSNERCQRAAILARVGRPEARVLADSGEQLAIRAGDRRQQGRCIQVLAQIAAGAGDINAAAEALGRAMPLFAQSRDHTSLAALLQWRGYLWNTLGQLGQARRDLTLAIAEGERAQAASPIGWSLINLGMISLELGDRVTADEQLQRARSLLETQRDEWGVITARGVLGGVARAAGDTATARAEYTDVLAWAERTGNVQVQRNMHDALAALAEMSGDWAVAERELGRARSIAAASGGSGWLAGQFFRHGRLALRRGDFTSAERALEQQLAKLDTSQHGLRYATRALLAEAYAKKGALERAEAELVRASDEIDRWRGTLPSNDLRARALEFSNGGSDADLGVASVIAALARGGRVEKAFALAEGRRARELTDRIQRARAGQASWGKNAGRALSAATVSDARGILRDDSTALLEYVTGRGGQSTTLFVLTRAAVSSRSLAPVDSIAADARRFATVIEGGGDVQPLAAKLGAALLQPAIDLLDQRVKRLVIVTDGILARVPFDALRIGDRYAAERFAIGLAPSASTVLALQARPASSRPMRILSFGDPEFAPERGDSLRAPDPGTAVYRSAFGAKSGGGLTRLVASGSEAKRVARYAPSAIVRVRSQASEAYVRGAPLDSFRVLHFATHALVDDETATRTALALAPGNGEDGFLGPADLSALALNADLVVLSACRTAGGVILAGEGVQGLTGPLL